MNKISILILILASSMIPCYASTLAQRQYNWVDDRNNGIPITASRQDAELDNIITKLNQKVLISSSSPSSPIPGELWYDSTNKLFKQYRNSEWIGVSVHVGTASPITSQTGDLWYDSTNFLLKAYNGSAYINLLQDNSTVTTLFSTGNIGIGTSTAASGRLIVIGGNVGIGSINPTALLDVQGSVRATSFTGQGNTGIATADPSSKNIDSIYGPSTTDGYVTMSCRDAGGSVTTLNCFMNTNATPASGTNLCPNLSFGGASSEALFGAMYVRKGYYYEFTESNCGTAGGFFTAIGS